MLDKFMSLIRRRRALTFLLGSVAIVGIAGGGGALWVDAEVRARLTQIADGAGLRLQLDDVTVRPWGSVALSGLRLQRGDGTDVVRVEAARAALSPLAALAGRRRPSALEVDGLRLEVVLRDGRPEELLDLLRAAKAALRRGDASERDADDPAGRERRPLALALRGGEVQIRVDGRFRELLPGGLRVHGIEVALDDAAGIGSAVAQVEGAVTSRLQAKVVAAEGAAGSGTDGAAMRVEGAFEPALALRLPPLPGLPSWIDGVYVAGFAYDAAQGPGLDGVSLRRGEVVQLALGRVSVDPAEGVRVGPIRVEPTLLAAWMAAADGGAPPAQAAMAAAKGRDLAKAGAGAQPDGRAPAARPLAPPAAPATLAAVTLAPTDVGGWRVDLEGGVLPLPAGLGELVLGQASIEIGGLPAAGSSPGGGAAIAITVEQVAAKIRWSRPVIVALPGGELLWRSIEQARERPIVAPPPSADEDDEEVDRPDLAPEARRPAHAPAKKRPRLGPASAAAIPALRAALDGLTAVDARISAALRRLDRQPGLTLQVEDARVELLEPAAALAACGLRAGKASLTARLADGSRGLELSAELFGLGAPDAVGAVQAKARASAGGRFDHAELTFAGGAVAMAARGLGAAVRVGPGASLGGSLTLRTEAEGSRTLVDGKLEAKDVGIDWWRLAPRPIDGLSFAAELHLVADAAARSLTLDLDPIRVGEARAQLKVAVQGLGGAAIKAPQAEKASADKALLTLTATLPKQDCGKLAAALPPAMLPTIGAVTAHGELGADLRLQLSLGNPYKGDFDANLDDAGCTVDGFANLDLQELSGEFARPVNESGTLLPDQLVGPASDAWVPLAELPAWVPYAMLATEDGAFYKHRGLRLGLLERAIKMNLDYGRFVYGGSTLTQQLVKNLYLTRDKHLGRKFEELLIVWQLERALHEDKVATKDRIMELYCNIVEFAPHLYGVHRAAQTYFKKDPRQLTPLEAAFLAANKPHPRVGYRVFESKKWSDWWQERMIGILRKMRQDGVITEQQFVAEAPYVPRFAGWPEPAAPAADGGGAVGVGGVEE